MKYLSAIDQTIDRLTQIANDSRALADSLAASLARLNALDEEDQNHALAGNRPAKPAIRENEQ